MIDIKLLRDEKTRREVYESEKNRFKDPEEVMKAYELDQLKIKMMYEKEKIAKEMNRACDEMKKMMKEGDDGNVEGKGGCNGDECADEEDRNARIEVEKIKNMSITEKDDEQNTGGKKKGNCGVALREKIAGLKARRAELEIKVKQTDEELKRVLKNIGNVLHKDVFVSKDEEHNPVITRYESGVKRNGKMAYYDVMERLGCVDMKRGSKVCGHRGYFLFEELALLENALVRYAIDFARTKGYTLVQTPVLMNRDVMAKTAQLSEFDEQLYAADEQYLIATSEQPLTALYMNERILPEQLPKKFCGQSLCFRREAGAAGKDNKGIFRVHQFEKIEQFVICAPEKSEEMHKAMLAVSEQFYQSLRLDYRVVSIVSGEMNDSACLKYDLEAYFPHSKRYRELVSCSNCTDYQARDLEVRYGITKENDRKVYCHMLNGTLCAVQRTLCCLVENYQEEEGVRVPDVLVKYYGDEMIRYV
ncbi:Seryl-tRNA synthetase [Trachipleistophora hominis]|uniref:serine--tRNA ligase n=1 Tax=Trachipleistophora hominis TaxID=72359 RepID=L7JWY4_TRAHO|nr:Seryl-tRNA synthetase [Trachipleistophora hominis]